MSQISSIENFNIAKFALRNWEPSNESSVNLKGLMLDFLEIIEEERNRLLGQREAKVAEQQQVEMALCHTHDAISITTTEGIVRMVNPAFEKLTGCSGYEIIGNSHEQFWTYDDPTKMDEMLLTIRSGRDWQGELSINSESGEPLELEVSVVPIITPMGEITHYVYTFHDITHRLSLERRLNRQKQFLERVINLNPSVILILDANGDWMLDNLAAKTLLSDLKEGARTVLSSKVMNLIKNTAGSDSKKLELRMPNGSRRFYLTVYEELPAKYLIPESDVSMVYLVTLSDITENERSNREILVRQKALTASRIEKSMIQGEFINGFIYHLQKPINVSKAGIMRLQKAVETGRHDKIDQAVKILKQELEFFERELTKYRTIPQACPENVEEITTAAELVDAIKVLYRNNTIEISYSGDSSIDYPLPYEYMQMLVKILVDNACESTEPLKGRSKVSVSFEKCASGSLLIVEDNGPGISHSDRYKIFEPFYSTKPNRTGLSLTILHQLINDTRGSVEIDKSNLGGTKATLFFPKESV